MKRFIMVLTVFLAVHVLFMEAVLACNDGDVRLIGGSTSRDGIVEICNGGVWGTVCENTWDVNDAKVVCRHLGYPVDEPSASTSTVPCCGTYGSGSGFSFLQSVNCTGTESSLLKCMHDGIGHYSCTSQIAGVSCPPCNNGGVQLINGSTSTEGRVEVCISGAWSGVCSDVYWNFQDAFVTCRQLGYPTTGAVAYSSPYFGNSAVNSLSNLLCYGNESSLFDCANTQGTSSCNSAGIRCQGKNVQEVICFPGSVNLVGGRNNLEGRVEVCSNGLWGTICDSDWDTREADVVCKEKGVQNSRHFVITRSSSSWFGGGSGPIFSVSCDGTESSLKACTYSSHINGDCDHSRDVGVQCVNLVTSDCRNGDVRLVNGQNDAEGTVEICNNNVWGFVCDTAWDYNDAAVVCSQLGFQGSNLTVYSNTHFGESSGPCHLEELNCNGYEANVLSCSRNPLGPHSCNCALGNEAGVKCNATKCNHGDVRLVGGYTDYEGYVEVCINGYWGHICHDGWDTTSAMVVCNQLFGDNIRAVAFQSCCQYYPLSATGAGNVTLYNLGCSRSPSTLTNCSYDLVQVHTNVISGCSESSYAAMRCYVPSSCNSGSVILVDARSGMEGRVEVCRDGVWGAVSGAWNFPNARVICRQLGFPSEWAIPLNGSFFGRGNSPILIQHVGCTGQERTLSECSLNTLTPSSTSNHSDQVLSVICQGNITSQHECSSGNIRLVGGERESEGRVEICVEGFWGTVCDSGWGPEEAMVVCSQSGYHGVGSVPVGAAYFGEGKGPIVSISCSGTELRIGHCMNTTGLVGCYHGKDAGVKCLAQAYDVTLTTEPSKGPFSIGSVVTLKCNVDPPPPPGVMLYTWTGYETLSLEDSSLPNASLHIHVRHPRRAWYHCRGHVGGVFLGVGSTVITVKGLLHPIHGSTTNFTPPKTITLQVELTATITFQRYLSRLTWYYNGDKMIPAGRVSLSNDDMTLTIVNSTESDAGMYEARFTRFLVYPYSKVCNDAAREALKHYPALLPAQFCVHSTDLLQESQRQAPKCKDRHTFAGSIEFTSSDNVTVAVKLDASGYIGEITSGSISWNFNGLSLPPDARIDEYEWYISREIEQSLHIDNAAFIDRGVYEAQLKILDIYSNRFMSFVPGCTNPEEYGSLLSQYINSSTTISIDVADIQLKYYEQPMISAVAENLIIPARSSLSQVLVCNATGGYPPISSISWVRNGRIIVENTTAHTVALTTRAEGVGIPLGLFVCRVNKSVAPTEEAVLIKERGKLQVELYSQCSGWENAALERHKEALQRSLVRIIQVQCSCSFTTSDLEDTALTCLSDGNTLTLTASLLYSSNDGAITASRVIRMLQDWATNTDTASLSLDGNSSATVSKICSPTSTGDAYGGGSTNAAVVGGFFGGLILGLVLATAAATAVVWILLRRKAQESGNSAVAPKSVSAVTTSKGVSSVEPPNAVKPRQAPSFEKIHYAAKHTSGVNVQQQDWYEAMSSVEPPKAVKPRQAPSLEKIRYTTKDMSRMNVQQQDWYEPMSYPNQDIYENPV